MFGLGHILDPLDIFNKRSKAKAGAAFKEQTNAYKKGIPQFDVGQTMRKSLGRYNELSRLDPSLIQKDYDQTGLNQFRSQATRGEGVASGWANMAQQERERALGQNLQNAANQSASGTANAWSQLAQSGGLRSGQAGRMAMAGANQLAAGQQGLRSASEGDASNIRMQDEQNRIAQLQALPGMEAAYRAPSLANLQTKLGIMGSAQDLYKGAYQNKLDTYNNLFNAQAGAIGAGIIPQDQKKTSFWDPRTWA